MALIEGSLSGNQVEVTLEKQLLIKSANPLEPNGAEHINEVGSVRLQAEVDAGTVTGEATLRALEVSSDYRLRVGLDHSVFNELFPGNILNSTLWTAPATTMTVGVSGGFANINAAGSLAINAVARLTTYRSFPCYKSYTTYFESELQFTSTPVPGNVCEWGAFISSGITAPTDGVFFRLNASGEFRAIVNYNGVETQSGTLDFNSLIGINTSKSFLIYIISNKAMFWIDNILITTIELPPSQGSTTSSMQLPISFRNYNSSAVSTAQIMKVSYVNTTLADQNSNKSWNSTLCGFGGHSSQGQTGTGTLGSTALYTNNLAVGAGAAMTNTTAALGTGLGGQFSALPTLAVGTDGIVSSFQVPLGSSTIPGKTLYITRLTLSSVVTGALTGGAVIYAYSLAYGHTNVSLATIESATTKAPRRLPVGIQTFASAAAIGITPNTIDLDLNSPIVVQPGEFVQLVAKNLGVVTTAGVITFMIGFGGYWE